MALEATFRELSKQLHQLHDALHGLNVTVGDQPENDAAALADGLDNTVLDLIGVLHQARKAALNGRQAVSHPVDMDRARRALTNCQERFHHIEQEFATNLVSYEKLRDLARLGVQRGGEWLAWAGSVKQGIEGCRQPIEAVHVAIAACWQELAERLGMTSITVQTTSIGQKISKEALESAEIMHEGVT